jgi:dienelactone hydrolase
MRADPPVRVLHDAAVVDDAVPPYDTVQLRVAYPAAPASTADPVLGLIGPDPARLPLPVCLLHPNFNVGPERYHWLAVRLALAGWAAVTVSWVARGIDGRPVLSAGIDLDRLGDRPNALLAPVLAVLDRGLLAGQVEVDPAHTVVGGHSAGGTTALLTPGVRAAFAYGGHVVRPDGTLLVPPPGPARLVMGGTHDGIVGTLSGTRGTALDKLRATVDACAPPVRLEVVDGADHYAVAEGDDGSSGRSYLEDPGPADPADVRRRVGDLVVGFLAALPAPA